MFKENVSFDRHGGPYDRGSADAYYNRPHNPHYFTGATYQSELVPQSLMTEEEINHYNLGYYDHCALPLTAYR